jgi:dimethylglycine dehydrogenase
LAKGKEILINKIPVKALRVNYIGELGWELHHPMDQMELLYDAIYEVGKKENITNFGTYAVNSLRMEKAYKDGAVNSPEKLVWLNLAWIVFLI